MHNSRGDDNTCAKLAHCNNESTIHADGCESRRQDRCKYTYGTGH
jgi:hypothetical protein